MGERWDEAWTAIDEPRRDAWTGLLRVHSTLVTELDRELRREHGLPLTSFDVLAQLGLAEGQELQMSQLADAVLLSRSGITRLVERLEREGLVERRRGERDPRHTYATLTAAGRERLAAVVPTHVAGIRRLFADRIGDEDAAALAAAWPALLDAAGRPAADRRAADGRRAAG